MSYICKALESNGKSFQKRLKLLITTFLSLNILLEAALSIMGKTFTVENGLVSYGSLVYMPILIQIVCFYCVFANAYKISGTYKVNPIIVFALAVIPYVSLFVMYKFSVLKHFHIFFVFAYMIMYITLGSNIAFKETERANIYKEMSVTDLLTGFSNHTGYQEYLKNISKEKIYSVVFCDVNSLKMTNDTIGHEAGDKLIKSVADAISEFLTDTKLCRISGDEFVCINESDTKDAFKEKFDSLYKALFDRGRIASCGYAEGKGEDIVNIIKDAEKQMYSEKSRYYIETGKNRRRT
ncbi:MAG: diguanylate cyclase [Treponema sp.]|nr:diguanylate cyclase [Treponema sp.]